MPLRAPTEIAILLRLANTMPGFADAPAIRQIFPTFIESLFVPESKQVVVECELPPPRLCPVFAEYRYVKSKDSLEEEESPRF